MAALDFPASPTSGQIFRAPNGVTYTWDAARSLWMPQPSSMPSVPPGDFCAQNTSQIAFAGDSLYHQLFPATIVSGNVGGYYNTTTGRYTPPAGRYLIYCTVSAGSSDGAVNCFLQLRKNGAAIYAYGMQVPNSATRQGDPAQCLIVDANGTDYFDFWLNMNTTNSFVSSSTFLAHPVGVVVAMPATGQGDFCSSLPGAFAIPTSPGTATGMPVISGNSGGWYVQSTGKYTPPAGRYYIYAVMDGNSPSAATTVQIIIRKNTTGIAWSYSGQPTTNYWTHTSCNVVIDANGTDVFDLQIAGSGTSSSGGNLTFGAYPISGVQGPPGLPGPGAMSLYSEQVLTVAGNAMAVNFPAAAKIVQLTWNTVNSATTDVGMFIQGTRSGVPETGSGYNLFRTQGSGTTSGAVTFSGDITPGTSWGLAGGWSQRGTATFTRPGSGWGVGQMYNLNNSGLRQLLNLGFDTNSFTGFDGFRATTNSGNWDAGSFLRCMVVI